MLLNVLIVGFIVCLVLVAGFFSGSETAVTSANKVTLRQLADAGDKRARIIQQLASRMEHLIGTTLVGTNVIMASATTLANVIVHQYVPEWQDLVTPLIMTPFILVFGEMVPKSIGRSRATDVSLRIARPLALAKKLFYPVVLFNSWIANFIGRLANLGTGASHGHVSRDDLRTIAAELAEMDGGWLPAEAGSMLRTIFELDSLPVSSIMVPLVNVRSLSTDATVGQVEELAAETGFSRFPVYEHRVDEVVGIIDVRDLLYARSQQANAVTEQTPIATHIHRNIVFVPETKSVGELVHELRYHRIPMAAAVDEHGGVVGVVTTEDLIEEVVGEILDERDEREHLIVPVGANTFDCDGKLEVRQLEEELGICVPKNGFETVAGLVLKLAGRIPRAGERFAAEGFEIEVRQTVGRRVAKIRIRMAAGWTPPEA